MLCTKNNEAGIMISRLYGINIKHTRFPCSVFFVRANVSKIQHIYSAKTSGIFNSKALPKVYSISQTPESNSV